LANKVDPGEIRVFLGHKLIGVEMQNHREVFELFELLLG
jgi:hypothetical protein